MSDLPPGSIVNRIKNAFYFADFIFIIIQVSRARARLHIFLFTDILIQASEATHNYNLQALIFKN